MPLRALLFRRLVLTIGAVSLLLFASYVILPSQMTSQWRIIRMIHIEQQRNVEPEASSVWTDNVKSNNTGNEHLRYLPQQQLQQQQQLQHHQQQQERMKMASSPSATLKTPIEESNASCQFPNQNPFDPDVMKHFVKPPSLNCSRDTLPSIVYHNGTHLRINQTKVLQIHVDFQYCYYIVLSRRNERSVSHSARSKSFTNAIELDAKHEDIVVTCLRNKTHVAKSYISIIRQIEENEKICEEKYHIHLEKHSPVETLSVLMIGLDGTSRQNSIRSMPETRRFLLQNLSAIELYKYNKVGDNTFPNVVPLLSGLSLDDLSKHWTPKEYFDEVDHLFVWNDYKNAGYRTAMVLDDSWITSFHYLKKGWEKPPFHYYHRNMVVELQKHENKRICIGDTPEVTHLLDYYLQLCTAYNNTRKHPYFAYSFSARITHDNPNLAVLADGVYLDFFKELSRRKVLNNTLVIWFSDHGARFGPIRKTRAGVMESKTPFIFFVFPEWFRTKYSDVMDTFRKNQHTLTTPYDVHATLKDLLYFKGSHTTMTMGQLSSRGISLFKEIPRERTCKHAGVPIEFCMCSTKLNNFKIIPEVRSKVASTVLEYVVNATSDYRDVCVVLKLASIKSIYPSAAAEREECSSCVNFLITIEVGPSGGEYEATVQYNPETGRSHVKGKITRLNMYKGQADCVDDGTIRLFCYCRNL